MSGNSPTIVAVGCELLRVALPASMTGFGYTHIQVPFVTVTDSDGASGTGFCYTLDAGAAIVCRMVTEFVGPRMLGRPLGDWERIAAGIVQETRRLGATMFTAASSAVDIAVWDLRGIRAAAPLHELLGGAAAAVPFYGSGRGGQHLGTTELVDATLGYLAEGYDGVKLSVGALRPEEDLARVRAVRSAIGDDARLMVDGSERMSLADALWLGHRMAELGLIWFEEPLLAEDVGGYAILSRQLPVPIATGEHLQSGPAFDRYFDETSVAVYQPDAALGGGISAMLAIAAAANTHGRPIAWHSLADLHVHLAVATPASRYVEDFPILEGILAERMRPAGGLATPPPRPGHGMLWDLDAIAHARDTAHDIEGVAR